MSKKLMLVLCAAALFAVSAGAQTVDELIEKNIKALGGLDKMKSVQAEKITGKMKMGPMEAPFTVVKKRPASFRLDFTIQGMTGTQAYDGSNGWMVMPFMGKKDPEKMSEDMLKNFRDEADFDGPMIDYKTKGNKVEYLGKEDVQGTAAYKMKIVTKEGNESTVFLDADSYLEIRSESKRKVQGQEMEQETTIGDWKEVGGLMFPFSIESKAKGQEGAQVLTIEAVELNPKTVEQANFVMPEVKKAEEKKAEEPKKQ